jgi:hypothetical protein
LGGAMALNRDREPVNTLPHYHLVVASERCATKKLI